MYIKRVLFSILIITTIYTTCIEAEKRHKTNHHSSSSNGNTSKVRTTDNGHSSSRRKSEANNHNHSSVNRQTNDRNNHNSEKNENHADDDKKLNTDEIAKTLAGDINTLRQIYGRFTSTTTRKPIINPTTTISPCLSDQQKIQDGSIICDNTLYTPIPAVPLASYTTTTAGDYPNLQDGLTHEDSLYTPINTTPLASS